MYAILFRFFRPDQLSEPVKVGRDRSGNVDRSWIMGHFDWQSTRQKAARNVGDWTDNGTGGGAVRLVIRHEESRWRSVNDDRNAWPSALCMTRAARTRPLINHVDCNISVYVMYIPFDFAALSKRNESNLKEEEEKIKFRRANENCKPRRMKIRSEEKNSSRTIPLPSSFLSIFSRKSWRKDIWSIEGGASFYWRGGEGRNK